MKKSREEVERLKRDWLEDPVFDLEDATGFEEHRSELATFAEKSKEGWRKREEDRVAARAAELECSPRTLLYIEQLERSVSRLSADFDALRDSLGIESPRP